MGKEDSVKSRHAHITIQGIIVTIAIWLRNSCSTFFLFEVDNAGKHRIISLVLALFFCCCSCCYYFYFLHRNVCSPKTSQTQPFMCTGWVPLEPMGKMHVNAGTLLSTARNVQPL